MLKKILALIVVFILVAAGASYFLYSHLDSLVQQALEKFGSDITGTAVKVHGVKISLQTGEGSISGLYIGNPKDFSSADAFEMDAISIALDTNSVLGSGPVIIRRVEVRKPHVRFEVNDSGASNLQALMNNIRNYSAPQNTQPEQAASSDPEKKAGSRKIIIKDFLITSGEIKISNNTLLKGKDITTPLSNIHLTNLGESSGGTTPAQVAKQVLDAITTTSLSDATSGMMRQLHSLNVNDVGTTVNKNAGAVSDKLKGIVR